MALLAVTVLGHDRPGIIADVTGALAGLGGNLEDSSMTRLRGHFAMTLVVRADAAPDAVEGLLAPLLADLVVSVRVLADEPEPAPSGQAYVLSVHGGDRPGIVSTVTRLLASLGGNVTDLTTRLVGDLYVMTAEVELPVEVDVAALQSQLADVARGLGVAATLHPLEPDVL
jgi:glycine cleavage system transcriptional repressor